MITNSLKVNFKLNVIKLNEKYVSAYYKTLKVYVLQYPPNTKLASHR
jgi:hypothetical protein